MQSQCLTLQNVELVAETLGVAPNSIRYWFEAKVLPRLPEVLANERPRPKPKEALPASTKRAIWGRSLKASSGKGFIRNTS